MRRYEIAWRMNEVIMAMNNEEAYYDSRWLEVFSDYHKDGLYKALPSVYDYALITCI